VRIPIPVVLLLCLAVIGGVWWYGTRKLDFMTPPSEQKLALVRAKVEATLPRADHKSEEIPKPEPPPPPPPPPPVEEPKPVIELGDLTVPPVLQQYSESAPKGAAHLTELAQALEKANAPQRALLAWERVIDSGKPDAQQTLAAISAIKRLRPTVPDWNTDAKKTIAITLQAGTGKKSAKALTPILKEIAKELEHASAGILKVTPVVTAGRDSKKPASAPAPVALWLTGSVKKPRSTEVMSFTMGKTEALREDVRKTVFQILQGFLGHKAGQLPPPAMADGEPALDALNSHITRLYWQELGTTLNLPPEKHE